MRYPDLETLKYLVERLRLTAQLQCEYGAQGIGAVVRKGERALESVLEDIETLPEDEDLALCEPNDLRAIRALRPDGPRRIWTTLDDMEYSRRLEGALLARCAGCTLGSIVENWPIEKMRQWAEFSGDPFPPEDYWSQASEPHMPRYGARRADYARDGIDGVPPDDDIAYTILGLLIAENHGVNFTPEDVATDWLRYLAAPMTFTAEKVALQNLTRGLPALRAGGAANPYCQWIGADIRSDPWGYMAPGLPEVAAEMAWRDAIVSHRRNGLFGAMFFSAAIAAAFTLDDPLEAIRIGLTEIPAECSLAKEVAWALETAPSIADYAQARQAVDQRFDGMHSVHTINNACLTIFGLAVGKGDVSRTISQTVAMGLDNDCTAATAGSIAGAAAGRQKIEPHWTRNFNNTIRTYLREQEPFAISDLLGRFRDQARRVFEQYSEND